MERPPPADDFAAIRARMEELNPPEGTGGEKPLDARRRPTVEEVAKVIPRGFGR